MTAYLSAMRSYATFGGRTSRGEFWRAHIVLLPLILVAFAGLGSPADGQPRSVWPILLFALILLPHLVPWAALVARRLHDVGHSGWWVVIALIPVMLILPLGIVLLLAGACIDGVAGPNRFGPDPLDRASAAAAAGGAGPVAPSRDPIAEVERLAALRASGGLTDTEFEVLKARALGQPRAGS